MESIFFSIPIQFVETAQISNVEKLGIQFQPVSVTPEYNFYLTPYENAIDPDILETTTGEYLGYMLPNIYTFIYNAVNNKHKYFDLIAFNNTNIHSYKTPVTLNNLNSYLNRLIAGLNKNPDLAEPLMNSKKICNYRNFG